MTDNFYNYTPAQFADEIGNLDADIKEKQERLDALKDTFKAMHISVARGQHFAVTVSETSTTRLDTKRLRAVLGEEIMKEYETVTSSLRLTIKALARDTGETQ